MQYFLLANAFHVVDDGETLPDGAIAVPRLPVDGEEWDSGTGAFVWNLAYLKQLKSLAVDERLGQAFLGGFTVPSGTTPALPASLVGHVLQTRNVTDRTNWLTSQAAYSAQVSAGNGSAMEASFRDADNVTVTVSYSDGLNTLLAMAAWGKALFQNSWSLKDQIAAAADKATLDAIDITTGW